MTLAAGILFLTADLRVLLLKRGAGGDHPFEWCFPGGTTEAGESALATAQRETVEEIGFLPPGDPKLWVRRVKDGMDFTTFIQTTVDPFTPTLNGEHTEFAWFPADAPPAALHPGCRIALEALAMDELGLARAIASGELASPKRYENVSLFDLRITGTGTAYRRARDEVVYRPPGVYLNDEFLARCAGLPVILEHPKKSQTLDSEEFNDRVVGTILLPYIKGDEVWGVAKIFDDATIELMETKRLSTSPAVVFRDFTVNESQTFEDGSKLLIEGKPSLLDHLAICELGVWDKGGPPSGVASVTVGDKHMTEAEMKAAQEAQAKADADRARADAETGEKLDKLLSCMDSLTKRMDSFEAEKVKKDSEEDEAEKAKAAAEKAKAAAEKAKKDAEEDEAAKAKTDDGEEDEESKAKKVAADKAAKDSEESAKKDADLEAARKDADELRARLDSIERKLPKELTDEDYAAMAEAQGRADAVAGLFGESAPRPLQGESLLAYRKRLVGKYKAHSQRWGGVNITAIQDAAAFDVIEGDVYRDARIAALNPTDLAPATLREVPTTDPTTGQRVITFVGDPDAWMGRFKSPTRRVAAFNTHQARN